MLPLVQPAWEWKEVDPSTVSAVSYQPCMAACICCGVRNLCFGSWRLLWVYFHCCFLIVLYNCFSVYFRSASMSQLYKQGPRRGTSSPPGLILKREQTLPWGLWLVVTAEWESPPGQEKHTDTELDLLASILDTFQEFFSSLLNLRSSALSQEKALLYWVWVDWARVNRIKAKVKTHSSKQMRRKTKTEKSMEPVK